MTQWTPGVLAASLGTSCPRVSASPWLLSGHLIRISVWLALLQILGYNPLRWPSRPSDSQINSITVTAGFVLVHSVGL